MYIAIDPSKFNDPEKIIKENEEFCQEVRDTGDTFVPGDLEVKRIAENESNGMEIDENLYSYQKDMEF